MTCCNSCPNLHKTTALTAAGLMTVTNDTNVGNFDKFCLVLTINPDSVITGAPVAYTVTINGVAVPIVDRWGYPVMSDRLATRTLYKGRFITTGGASHITLMTVPSCAYDVVVSATASSTDSTEAVNPSTRSK